MDLSRCILCYRCVRICDEVEGRGVWQVWNRGDRTLIRPDGPTLATSSCVGCGACADTCPSGALGDRHPEDGSPPDRWTRTTCPYCGVGCELEIASQGTRLLRTRPVLDAPVNKGHGHQFAYTSAEEIWEEIRSVWPEGRGIGYRRLETGGLQWPCPSEDHPGTTVLPLTAPNRPAARLFCQPFVAPRPGTGGHFPFVLNTGRRRDRFNSGSMTRSPGWGPAPGDTLDLAPDDLKRLGLKSGERVRVISLHGEIEAVVRPEPTVLPGQPFTGFHDVETGVNRLMGPEADSITGTPAYKATPIRIEKRTPKAG
ncbi:MAG: molybdopterin dinucleotide binding domain-containing protein [Verrucomicrobiota bacterium]